MTPQQGMPKLVDVADADRTVCIASVAAWLHATAPGARLVADSRRVQTGDVFLACAASADRQVDGRHFIAHAIERGACAVLFDAQDFSWDGTIASTLPHLACRQLQQMAGLLASQHYGHPDVAMFAVAVTGTNGKTSCSQWIGAALSRSKMPTVVIGTFGVSLFTAGLGREIDVTGYTTPAPVQLQTVLAHARALGATALAIEASSIGLQQQRMQGLHVDVALFTNLTRDHLDYHGDMAAYEAAKTRLFDWPGLQHAVINLDDPMGQRLVTHLRQNAPSVRLIGYSVDAPAGGHDLGHNGIGLYASDVRSNHSGTQFLLQGVPALALKKPQIKTHLVGNFNVSNVLGVMGVLLARGLPVADAIVQIEALQPVCGRMQQLGGPDQPLVVIDYAHTPDALEKTLASLRLLARPRQGQLWCVFGCGGDRDPGKRAQMGTIAQAADHVVLTSDNPRHELPAAIIANIVAGMDDQHTAQIIEDRATAILWALRHAGKNDVILLAGKGHENYQEIKGRKLPFLDADHAALAMAARATMKGPL